MSLDPNGAKISKVKAVSVPDGNGGWRVEIKMDMTKFDEESKGRFLAAYKEHGRMGDSCKAAGVTSPTVRRHLKSDIEFAEALLEAEETYKSRLISHHQDLVFNGTERTSYDRQGNVASVEKIYPIQLIAMELRKHDEGYRDKRSIDVAVTSGVMVAPPELTLEEWEAQYGRELDDGTNEDGKIIDHDDNAPIQSI